MLTILRPVVHIDSPPYSHPVRTVLVTVSHLVQQAVHTLSGAMSAQLLPPRNATPVSTKVIGAFFPRGRMRPQPQSENMKKRLR